MSATLYGTPATSITLGTGAGAIALPWTAAANGLRVSLVAPEPPTRRAGNGQVESFYLPGYGLRTLTIEATTGWGVAAPNLSTLSLPATLAVVIVWPHGGSTTLSCHVEPPREVACDPIAGTITWALRAHERAAG